MGGRISITRTTSGAAHAADQVRPSPGANHPLTGPSLGREEFAALGRRLRRLPPDLCCYGWCKVRLDPVYPSALAALAGCSRILDLGAGIGLLEALLASRAPEARVRAVEWDARKAKAARRLLGGSPGAVVEQGDAWAAEIGHPDAVLLIDVLHYAPQARQRELLERCAHALAPGGALVVRDLDASPARGDLSVRLERLAVKLGWNRGAGVEAWPPSEMAALLRGLGFEVRLEPSGRGLFSANALLVARKPDPSLPFPESRG